MIHHNLHPTLLHATHIADIHPKELDPVKIESVSWTFIITPHFTYQSSTFNVAGATGIC